MRTTIWALLDRTRVNVAGKELLELQHYLLRRGFDAIITAVDDPSMPEAISVLNLGNLTKVQVNEIRAAAAKHLCIDLQP